MTQTDQNSSIVRAIRDLIQTGGLLWNGERGDELFPKISNILGINLVLHNLPNYLLISFVGSTTAAVILREFRTTSAAIEYTVSRSSYKSYQDLRGSKRLYNMRKKVPTPKVISRCVLFTRPLMLPDKLKSINIPMLVM